jgi:hypothetical protein
MGAVALLAVSRIRRNGLARRLEGVFQPRKSI